MPPRQYSEFVEHRWGYLNKSEHFFPMEIIMFNESLNYFRVWVCLVFWQVAAGAAAQGHEDLTFSVQDGRIVTNTQKAVGSFVQIDINDESTLWITSNPGFNAGRGALEPNASVFFSIDHSLIAWGDQQWSMDAAQEEQIRFFKNFEADGSVQGDQVTIIPNMDLPVDGIGFEIAKADAAGRLHQHWWFDLADQNAGVPSEGIYAFSFRFSSPGLLPSEPVWFVFNNNAPSSQLLEAVALVPEPVAIGPLACLSLLLLRSRGA